MYKQKSFLNKMLVIAITLIFIGVAIAPCISVVSKEIETQETIKNEDEAVVTCYIFNKKGKSQQEVVLSSDNYERFYSMFKELNHQISYKPYSSETKVLKADFADLIENIGMIPKGSSKDDVISLMNPSIDRYRPLFSLLPSTVSGERGSQFFCNFATWGEGSQFPVIILPRLIPILLVPIPRVIMRWNAINGITSCGGLLSGKGFIAEGAQKGTALGFWGIGFSVFLPPVMEFGFIGYALFATATAENIIPWPPNRPPDITYEKPSDGSVDVPLSLSELSFHISDLDGDIMNYTVYTDPYIGSDSGNNVVDGTYTISISGLESDTEYSWRVIVTDGEDTTEETYSFRTELEAPIVSEPLPVNGDNWVYIELSELSFRLEDFQSDPMDYTVETVPDIGSDSGNGVGNGIYSVPVTSLEYTRDYTWFINVTDGKYWTRKVFVFKTQPIMVFNPFNMGWSYRKQITINHSEVAGDLVDFPVLISLTDVDLRDKTQEGGDDVLFMDGDGVASRLLHEIEFFDGSSGELVAWVKVPSLSSDVDSVFYLYYGNSGCGSQEYPDRVWNSHYCGVWHLNEDPIEFIHDSTTNNNYGISYGWMTPENLVDGIIGNCVLFDGDDDYIAVADSPSLKPESVSLQAFFKPLENNLDPGFFLVKASYDIWGNADGRTYGLKWSDNNEISARFERDAKPQGEDLGSYIASLDSWNQIVLTFDEASSSGAFYVNGIKYDSGSGFHESVLWYNKPWDFLMGGSRGHEGSSKKINHWFKCCLDEIRVSGISLDQDWISTEYSNQNNPSVFFSIGPEETGP